MVTHAYPLTNRMKRMFAGRRWLTSSSLAVILLVAFSGQIFAGGWCRADPIVEINGEEIQVWVAIPENMQRAVNGPIEVQFSKPWKADAHVVYLDEGFNGHGERVRFFTGTSARSDGSMDIQIFVQIPVDSSKLPPGVWTVPVQLEIITDKGKKVVDGTHWWTSTTVRVGG